MATVKPTTPKSTQMAFTGDLSAGYFASPDENSDPSKFSAAAFMASLLQDKPKPAPSPRKLSPRKPQAAYIFDSSTPSSSSATVFATAGNGASIRTRCAAAMALESDLDLSGVLPNLDDDVSRLLDTTFALGDAGSPALPEPVLRRVVETRALKSRLAQLNALRSTPANSPLKPKTRNTSNMTEEELDELSEEQLEKLAWEAMEQEARIESRAKQSKELAAAPAIVDKPKPKQKEKVVEAAQIEVEPIAAPAEYQASPQRRAHYRRRREEVVPASEPVEAPAPIPVPVPEVAPAVVESPKESIKEVKAAAEVPSPTLKAPTVVRRPSRKTMLPVPASVSDAAVAAAPVPAPRTHSPVKVAKSRLPAPVSTTERSVGVAPAALPSAPSSSPVPLEKPVAPAPAPVPRAAPLYLPAAERPAPVEAPAPAALQPVVKPIIKSPVKPTRAAASTRKSALPMPQRTNTAAVAKGKSKASEAPVVPPAAVPEAEEEPIAESPIAAIEVAQPNEPVVVVEKISELAAQPEAPAVTAETAQEKETSPSMEIVAPVLTRTTVTRVTSKKVKAASFSPAIALSPAARSRREVKARKSAAKAAAVVRAEVARSGKPAVAPTAAPRRSARISAAVADVPAAEAKAPAAPAGFRVTSTGQLVALSKSSTFNFAARDARSTAAARARATVQSKQADVARAVNAIPKANPVPEWMKRRKAELAAAEEQRLEADVARVREEELHRGQLASSGSAPRAPTSVPTVPAGGFVSSVERRLQERAAWETKRAANEAKLTAEREAARMERETLEQQEYMKQRAKAVPKANPVPVSIYGAKVTVTSTTTTTRRRAAAAAAANKKR